VAAVGAAIVTAGSGTGSQPAATTPAPTVTEAPPVSTGTTTTPGTTAGAAWFVQDGKLTRLGTPATGPDAVQPALELLLGGPRAALMATGESGGGFTTAIPAATQLESVDVADTIATVRLSGPAPTGTALEQVVRTVTDTGVHWVRFGDEPGLVNATIAAGKTDDAPPVELVRAQSDGSKVQFAGTADTFEANVQLRLMQGDKQLAHTFVTATCGTGCRGSFDGTLDVPAGLSGQVAGSITTGTEPVRLEAYTISAADGSERDLISTLVTGG
jgi:hypothetical protein